MERFVILAVRIAGIEGVGTFRRPVVALTLLRSHWLLSESDAILFYLFAFRQKYHLALLFEDQDAVDATSHLLG